MKSIASQWWKADTHFFHIYSSFAFYVCVHQWIFCDLFLSFIADPHSIKLCSISAQIFYSDVSEHLLNNVPYAGINDD